MFSNLKQLSLPLYSILFFSPWLKISRLPAQNPFTLLLVTISSFPFGEHPLLPYFSVQCVLWRWENNIPWVTVVGSRVGMWTNEGINVSLRILLELLRETVLCFGWDYGRSLKLLGGHFTITHEESPWQWKQQSRKQNWEIQRKTDSWTLHQDQACLKLLLSLDFSVKCNNVHAYCWSHVKFLSLAKAKGANATIQSFRLKPNLRSDISREGLLTHA